MDRLKTKLQVKSFITKKIINEINRKIGLKYLTEGPEQLFLNLFSGQKDDEKTTKTTKTTETTEKQVPQWDPLLHRPDGRQSTNAYFDNEYTPTKLSTLLQQASENSWDATALSTAAGIGSLFLQTNPRTRAIGTILNQIGRKMPVINFGIQGTRALLNPTDEDAILSGILAGLGAGYRGIPVPPSGIAKNKQLVTQEKPGYVSKRDGPELTATLRGDENSVRDIVGSPGKPPEPNIVRDVKVALADAAKAKDVKLHQPRRRGKFGKMSEAEPEDFVFPNTETYRQDSNAARDAANAVSNNLVTNLVMSLWGKLKDARNFTLVPHPADGSWRFTRPSMFKADLVPKDGFGKPGVTDPRSGAFASPDRPISMKTQNALTSPRSLSLGDIYSHNPRGYRIGQAATLSTLVGANMNTIDNQGSILSDPFAYLRGLPVTSLDYSSPFNRDITNPYYTMPTRAPSSIMPPRWTGFPWEQVTVSPEERSNYFKNPSGYGAQRVSTPDQISITTDPSAAEEFFKSTR